MKYIKFVIKLSFLFLFLSCSNIVYKYNNDVSSHHKKISLALKEANYISENEFYLIFTKGFLNSEIKILDEKGILFEDTITTKTSLIAKSFKLKYGFRYQIKLESLNDKILILPEKSKNYKYVYISKSKNKVFADFNNGKKIK
jgi:hypothetical protein